MLCITDYWQLLANAMADEREKMRFEIFTHLCYTCSTFGCGKKRSWPCTIGMNEKMRGMTTTSQRSFWAFLAKKKHQVFSSRHQPPKHLTRQFLLFT
jgi:hypothetical protein